MLSTVLLGNDFKSNNFQHFRLRGPRILFRVLENQLPGRILQNSKHLLLIRVINFKPTGDPNPNRPTCGLLLPDSFIFCQSINIDSLDFLQYFGHYDDQIVGRGSKYC